MSANHPYLDTMLGALPIPVSGYRHTAPYQRRGEASPVSVQAQEDLYRLRVKQVRYRPYVYLLNEKPLQVDSRTHGLILVGPDIGVSYPNEVRRTRSDQRTLEPLFEFGKTRIYFERDWQEAGK